MNDIVLKNNIENLANHCFKVKEYALSFEKIEISMPKQNELFIDLKKDCIYIFAQNIIDIPKTAFVSIKSENNYLQFSKESFETKTKHENLRGYMKINTSANMPFFLTFIVIRPIIR